MHPHGTIKAPANPHTTRAGGAEREGDTGGVKAIWIKCRIVKSSERKMVDGAN